MGFYSYEEDSEERGESLRNIFWKVGTENTVVIVSALILRSNDDHPSVAATLAVMPLILESLEVCKNSAGNVHVRRAISVARRGVTSGKVLGKQMVATGVFPNLVCQMITVGEATGALDTMLAKMANFYEEEVEGAVGALVALIEPALMVFLGIVVGGILISMYLPIFIMSSAVGHF